MSRKFVLGATTAALAAAALLPGTGPASADFSANRFRGTVNGSQSVVSVTVLCGAGQTRGPAKAGQTIGVKRAFSNAAPTVGTNDTIRAVLADHVYTFKSFGTKSLGGGTFPCTGGVYASFKALNTGQKDTLKVNFVNAAS
jgi:hypothetical protein